MEKTTIYDQAPQGLINEDVLYSTRDAARFLGRSPRTLEHWRRHGLGPRVTRLHTRALPLYRGRDLREAMDAHGSKRASKNGRCAND